MSSLSSSKPKYPIAYVEIRVFSHATEDLSRVETAVRNLLPDAVVETLAIKKTSLIGHHGNPIVLVEATLDDKSTLVSVLQKLGSALSSLDKAQLAEEIDKHIEKHNLYLRFDKQNAFLGTIKTETVDPIHVKVHFKNLAGQAVVELVRQAGLVP